MKTNIVNFLILIFIVLTPSCYVGMPWNGLEGEGPVIERKVEIKKFSGITVPGNAKIYLTQGSEQTVRIEGQENIIDNLILDVSDEVWRIEGKKPVWKAETLKIYITLENLKLIKISGSGDVYTQNHFTGKKDLELRISGSGTLNLDIEADDIDGSVSGSGDIFLTGSADKLNLGISGSGKIKAEKLEAQSADVRITGSGNMDVWVVEKLEASVSGSGNVYYAGNPRVNTRVSGSGNVRAR
jgi:hypothetical protein